VSLTVKAPSWFLWSLPHLVSGCPRKSFSLIVLLTSTRLGFLLRIIPRRKARISLIHIHLSLEWPLFDWYSPWLSLIVFSFIKWTWRQLSLMESWTRKSTRCVSYWNLCMTWNKYLSNDTRSLTEFLLSWALPLMRLTSELAPLRGVSFIHIMFVCWWYILIFCTNIVAINEVKSFLSKSFDIKAMGEDDVILNIKLIKDDSGITLYNLTILRRSWTNLIL